MIGSRSSDANLVAPADATVPIACTLPVDDRPHRLAEFSALRAHLMGWSREGEELVLRFDDDPGVATQVRQLSDKEQRCCAFLAFDVASGDGSVVWTVTAGDAAAPALDEFLALLASSPDVPPG